MSGEEKLVKTVGTRWVRWSGRKIGRVTGGF